MKRLRMAWLDALIGWHQGHAERREAEAARHREAEARWRARYRREFPRVWDRWAS